MALRDPPGERSVEALLAFGVVNLDKPPGPSSHQVSAWMRDLVGVERAAHAGTLDPKVTGCLPVLLGDATRLSSALLGRKEYVAVLELHGSAPSDLEAVLAEFVGPIYQKPPRKSAVARQLRVREIHGIDLLDRADRKVLLRIACESGTYVRKLCHDLGLALGTGAHMGDLRRAATKPFDDSTMVTMHDVADALAAWREEGDEGPLRETVSPAERAIEHLPRVTMAASAAEQVAEGAPVYAPGVLGVDESVEAEGATSNAPLVASYTPDGSAVCLGRLVGDPDADSGVVVDLERVLV
ncbi:MAG TPA: RNA-guided pseudouridylation complex pseudouridine synthase subunit Cbf5 [Halobacteriales archaeon]|nr:RNA-guided pseudouridylation complex pseudouridine synthase subunit Cbf5 [Halobacteriales archaeon]